MSDNERRGRCPDDGTCHSVEPCGPRDCYRVKTCGPLTGAFPGDVWPGEVAALHTGEPWRVASPLHRPPSESS